MSVPDPLTAFYLALEDNPGDAVTLQALADWFEEQGEADNAACVRWTVRRGLFPFTFRRDGSLVVNSPTLKDGWHWWAIDDPYYGVNWGHPRSCKLPSALWRRLRHPFDYEPSVFKHYETVRETYEALFEVWPRVSPAERERRS